MTSQVQWHKYIYEVWPDPMPVGTHPLMVAEHVVLYVREGATMQAPTVPEGYRAWHTGHARYQCNPPCNTWERAS